jgi:RNA-directed DNA polymerase
MMPTVTGGERPLGMPTGLDRVMQPAIAQVIGPRCAPHVSPHSDGCRPGRRASMALAETQEAHRDGLRSGADGDLKRFCDTVHHGVVRHRLARRMADRRVLRRMGRSWRAGVLWADGSRERTPCGVLHGGPRSPLRAKGMLDDVDQALARRGRRCARSADDVLIFVRRQRAAPRVVRSSSRGIEGRLRRRITPSKRKAARRSAWTCRGFEGRRGTVQWTDAAVNRCKERVRAMPTRSTGRSMQGRLEARRR